LDDKEAMSQFGALTFKELITCENNSLIKRFLEASVKVESGDSDEAMRMKYSSINKVCSTYFSRNENIAFIGITLL
jgi:hypothetical protein